MLFNGALVLSYVLLGSLQTLVNFSSRLSWSFRIFSKGLLTPQGIVEYLTLFTMMAGLLRIRTRETRSSATDDGPSIASYRTGLHNPIIFCITCFFALGLSLIENPVVFAGAVCLPLLGIILVHFRRARNAAQI